MRNEALDSDWLLCPQGPDRSAAGQDPLLQEADRGGGRDRCTQPGQVPTGTSAFINEWMNE